MMRFVCCFIFMLGCFLTGCRTSRQSVSTTSSVKDSVYYRETYTIDTLRIPSAAATVRIQLDSIPLSYTGILATERQGPATVTIYREATGAIRAVAGCDSVMQLLLSKLTENHRDHNRESESIREKVVYKTPAWFRSSIAGLVLAVLFLFINSLKRYI